MKGSFFFHLLFRCLIGAHHLVFSIVRCEGETDWLDGQKRRSTKCLWDLFCVALGYLGLLIRVWDVLFSYHMNEQFWLKRLSPPWRFCWLLGRITPPPQNSTNDYQKWWDGKMQLLSQMAIFGILVFMLNFWGVVSLLDPKDFFFLRDLQQSEIFGSFFADWLNHLVNNMYCVIASFVKYVSSEWSPSKGWYFHPTQYG